MLGLGRTLYSKYGNSIRKVLFFSSIGAVLCYLSAALTELPVLGLFACGLTGFCTAMLWPGCLVVGADHFASSGVFIYAMMAAGGDLGASVGPQLVGLITDLSIANPTISDLSIQWGLTSEQMGMKIGLLVGVIFPLIGVFVFWKIWKMNQVSGKM